MKKSGASRGQPASELISKRIAELGDWVAQTKRDERVSMAKKIKVNIFDDMREALRDAAAYERGKAVNLRVRRIPSWPMGISPRETRRIRQSLKASQPPFATYLNVSTNAVRSWEQGTRRPRQAALMLLMIAKKDPKALLVA
jgi:putative transcriptional regulator